MNRASAGQLLAAADRVELIPPAGGRLGGFGCRFEAIAGSLDRLFARLLLLESGSTRVLWVSCDLLGLSTTQDRNLREQLAAAISTSPQNVLISCTHTHSAPVAMPARGPSGVVDQRWLEEAVLDRITQCARSLVDRLSSVVSMKTGQQLVSGFAYNRQDAASPIDEHVLSLCLIGENQQPIATIVNYALHPVVIGETNLKCSADYPGYVCSYIESTLGGVALFIQGSCGDVDPAIYRAQGRHAGTVNIIRQIGETIGKVAVESLVDQNYPADGLAIQSCRIAVPLYGVPRREEVEALKAQFEKDRGASVGLPTEGVARGAMYQLAWANDLLSAIDRDEVPESLSVHVTALRIGEVYVLSFPFELYSYIGLELRRQLAPRQVMIAAYTHGLIGYVVTSSARKQGGYGAGFSHRYFPELLTAIGEGADDLLIAHGVSLVRSIDQSSLV